MEITSHQTLRKDYQMKDESWWSKTARTKCKFYSLHANSGLCSNIYMMFRDFKFILFCYFFKGSQCFWCGNSSSGWIGNAFFNIQVTPFLLVLKVLIYFSNLLIRSYWRTTWEALNMAQMEELRPRHQKFNEIPNSVMYLIVRN